MRSHSNPFLKQWADQQETPPGHVTEAGRRRNMFEPAYGPRRYHSNPILKQWVDHQKTLSDRFTEAVRRRNMLKSVYGPRRSRSNPNIKRWLDDVPSRRPMEAEPRQIMFEPAFGPMRSQFQPVLKEPPNREKMLSGCLTEEERRETIVKRANYLVIYDDLSRGYPATEWPSRGWGWREGKGEDTDESEDTDEDEESDRGEGVGEAKDRGLQYPWSVDRLCAVLKAYQEMWQVSRDRMELEQCFEGLAKAGRLPNVDRIVCFGLGQPGGSRTYYSKDEEFSETEKSLESNEDDKHSVGNE